MINAEKIEVIDSWDLSDSYGFIADLKHQLDGLATGSILKSERTGEKWKVMQRVLFNHTSHKRLFSNEELTYMHFRFDDVEKMIESANNILAREEEGIFEYRLQPIGHKSKPAVGDLLVNSLMA